MKMEKHFQKKQSTAWEIRSSPKKDGSVLNGINKIDETRMDLHFDDQGTVEFKLLNELVYNGKMSFYEAIFMIIRERASLFELFGEDGLEEVEYEYKKEESGSMSYSSRQGSWVD